MSHTLQVEVPINLGDDCAACTDRFSRQLTQHPGVTNVEGGPSDKFIRVYIDPEQCSTECLGEAADAFRRDLSRRFDHDVLRVSGMDCADCAQTIQRAVIRAQGVSDVDVNFPAGRMRVEYESPTADKQRIANLVKRLGYGVTALDAEPTTEEVAVWKRAETHTFASAALLALALLFDFVLETDAAGIGLYAAAIAVGGLQIARAGIAALFATRRADIRFLMTVAVIGAAAIGSWPEAALVVVLFSIGEMLEARSVEHARRELTGLVSLAPDFANLRRSHTMSDGATRYDETQVLVSELKIGDEIVIRPGESIAADGSVVEGTSSVNQAPITGESTPVDKAAGDDLFAGTLNVQGLLLARVSAAPGDSTLDRIGKLIEEAQARKSPSERWVDGFARIYTPAVMLAAVLVAALPPLIGSTAFADSFYSALALLILACPCALVISTPVAIVSALARASAAGVLIKGGAHLEAAASISTVAFDKTGTLTEGLPRVVSVDSISEQPDELLALAASLEQGSEHPLARAIIAEAVRKSIDLQVVDDFEALVGLGARGSIGGSEVRIGNLRLFDEADFPGSSWRDALKKFDADPHTRVLVSRDGTLLGSIALADTPRPEAAQAILALHSVGVNRTVMLTGDNHVTAQAVADALGIDELQADLLPQDKVSAVTKLGPGVAMVGDGVNDAPALAAADLGIAMGGAGSATAVEIADIALMGDNPIKVAGLVGTARWTKAVVRQNIAFSLGTKLFALVLLAAGTLPLWAAVATDVGASLVVVGNSLRLLDRTPNGRMRNTMVLEKADQSQPVEPAVAAAPGCCDSC